MSDGTDLQLFPIPPGLTDEPLARGLSMRVVTIDGQPWFSAADVCAVLGLGNPARAMERLDSDEYQQVSSNMISSNVGGRAPYVVNQFGLFSLILGSRKPEARQFKRWVTHEVLPAIAATGSYGAPARELTRREILNMAMEAEDAWVIAVQRVAELEPAAEGYDEVINADGLYSLATAAQVLGTGRARLIQDLHAMGALLVRPGHSDHLRPRQNQVQAGRFVVKLGSYEANLPDGTKERRASSTTYVTPKGLDWIRGQRRSGPASLVRT